MSPEISILYVYFNTPQEIASSIKTIPQAIGKASYEVIIVDNNSKKKLPMDVFSNKNVMTLRNKKNIGFGAAVNQAVKRAKGEYILIVNPDTLFSIDIIRSLLLKLKKDKKIGVIGPKYINEHGKTLSSVSGIPSLPGAIAAFSILDKLFPNNPFSKKYWRRNIQSGKTQTVPAIGGACMLFRREAFEKVRGFDERFFMYFEEADICYRLKKAGYRVIYHPKVVITHLVGRSTQDKEWIQKQYEKSRFTFFRKYHGMLAALLGEGTIRLLQVQSLALLGILLLSLFLNLYKIDTLMMFIGDAGRDYLAARDMLLTGKIPFVGIQSSVTWLHQGPLSIYLIGLAFLASNFNPVAPAILYGILGTVATFFVHKLGKEYFNSRVGLLASLFFATSPLFLVNTRAPYHTSPIPLFASIAFFVLFLFLKGKKKYLFPFFLVIGLLIQLELSNVIILPIVGILYFLYKPIITKTQFLKGILGFLVGISPFIIYDITHGFVQTIGFPLWIVNRIRIFFGIAVDDKPTSFAIGNALYRIYQQLVSAIFPVSKIITYSILAVSSIIAVRDAFQKKNKGLIIVLLWIFVPLLGYLVHTAPGPAYFPFLFPAISLLVGYTVNRLSSYTKIIGLLFIVGCLYNVYLTVNEEYFLYTRSERHAIPPESYTIGLAYGLQNDIIDAIITNASNKPFQIRGGGFLSTLESGIDNYKYLLWYKGGKILSNAELVYTIYEEEKAVPKDAQVVYKNQYVTVTSNE